MSAISKMFVSHLADKGIRGSRVSSVKVTFHLKHLPDHSIHSDRAVSGLYGFTPTLYEILKKVSKDTAQVHCVILVGQCSMVALDKFCTPYQLWTIQARGWSTNKLNDGSAHLSRQCDDDYQLHDSFCHIYFTQDKFRSEVCGTWMILNVIL